MRRLKWNMFNLALMLLVWLPTYTVGGSAEITWPIIIWTQRSHIFSKVRGIAGSPNDWLTARFRSYLQSIPQENGFRYGIAYNHVTGSLFWSDRHSGAIYEQSMNDTFLTTKNTSRTVLRFTEPGKEIRGLAIDWHTGNLYFAVNSWIVVAPSHGTQDNIYKVLFDDRLESPSGIAVDSDAGLVFWTDVGKVERADLIGQQRRTLASENVKRPLGITLDTKAKYIYWVDKEKSTIEKASYDGNNKETLSQKTDGGYFGITMFNEYLFVTTEEKLKLEAYDKATGVLVKENDIDATVYFLTMAQETVPKPPNVCTDKCEHICLNAGNGRGICSCKTGYFLAENGRSCTEKSPQYIYSAGKRIMAADIRVDGARPDMVVLDETTLEDDMNKVQALDYHYREHLLYFSDTERKVVYRKTAADPKIELTVNTRLVEGIAVDWLVGAVYWSDRYLSHIMMSKLDGRYHRIHMTDVGEPTGVALDARQKKFFWNDARAKIIYSSMLDGRGRSKLAQAEGHPQGLSLDPHDQRLYWVDVTNNKIMCIDYQGSAIEMYQASLPGQQIYDVTIYQDLTTWTDNKGGLTFASANTGILTIDGTSHNSIRESYDVIAYDPFLQPLAEGACDSNNGGCEQHCFPTKSGGRSCECAIGFQLNSDKLNCDTVTRSVRFLLYTDPYHKQIYQMGIINGSDTYVTRGIKLPMMDFPITSDFDSHYAMVYWIDNTKRELRGSNLDGQEEKLLTKFSKGSSPQRLVVDTTYNRLFYTDKSTNCIHRLRLDGSEQEQIVKDIDSPFALAYNYKNNTLYWTSSSKIETSTGDGESREILADNLRSPSGIAVYPEGQMLYYSDQAAGRIYAYDLQTAASDVIFVNETLKIYALAVSSEYIFFTAYNEKGIYQLNREDGSGLLILGEAVFARLTDLKVVETKLTVVVIPGDGFNWIIVIGAGAAFLLLLLFLLVGLLAARHRKKKKREQQQAAGNGEQGAGNTNTGFDEPNRDVNQEYTYLNHSTLFDIRQSHNAMNGQMNGNGQVPNGGGDTTGVAAPEPVMESVEPDLVAEVGASTAVALGTGVVTAVPPVPRRKGYHKKHAAKGDPSFEFGKDGKVGTKIQRLANRLRNRLSTVRWSGGGALPNPEDVTYENPPPEEVVSPQPTQPHPKADMSKVVPRLHQQPRGFAPASHAVPQAVRTSWHKGKLMTQASGKPSQGAPEG